MVPTGEKRNRGQVTNKWIFFFEKAKFYKREKQVSREGRGKLYEKYTPLLSRLVPLSPLNPHSNSCISYETTRSRAHRYRNTVVSELMCLSLSIYRSVCLSVDLYVSLSKTHFCIYIFVSDFLTLYLSLYLVFFFTYFHYLINMQITLLINQTLKISRHL